MILKHVTVNEPRLIAAFKLCSILKTKHTKNIESRNLIFFVLFFVVIFRHFNRYSALQFLYFVFCYITELSIEVQKSIFMDLEITNVY